MKTFYQYLLTFRGKTHLEETTQLADWAFHDHDFPKHSINYHEISNYLEWNSPFIHALNIFDELWQLYKLEQH